MVVDTAVHFPELGSTLISIDRVTRKDDNVYLDAQAMAEGLFNDHMATNPHHDGRGLPGGRAADLRGVASSGRSGSTACRWR